MLAEITSPNNATIKETRALGLQRKEREARGLAVLEGVRLAEEAVSARLKVEWFLCTPELAEKERGRRAIDGLLALGARGYRVPEAVLAKAADTEAPQGIVAVWAPRHWQMAELGPGVAVICDGLQDPGNLGTIIRTAEALGAGGVVLTRGAVDPYNPKVVRSAMGSLFRLPVIRGGEPEEVAGSLTGLGYRLAVAEADGKALPWEAPLAGKVALVIGSEAHGPSAEMVAAAQQTLRIPMPGPAESLNAGVAASLLLYEALRQQQTK